MATLTTSGTDVFQLSVDDIIEQSLQSLGDEFTSGIEASKARRVLNLLLIELQNKNIPLSKIATVNLNTVASTTTPTPTYTLDPSILDVLNVTVSISPTSVQPQTDIKIEKIGLKQFQEIPNKSQTNRPNTCAINRLDTGCTITFWPVPDQIYACTLLCSVKIQDVNAAYQTIDLPTKYLPLLIAWLSYKLSFTRTVQDPNLRPQLQAEYKEIYMDTVEEDRERADFNITIGGVSGR